MPKKAFDRVWSQQIKITENIHGISDDKNNDKVDVSSEADARNVAFDSKKNIQKKKSYGYIPELRSSFCIWRNLYSTGFQVPNTVTAIKNLHLYETLQMYL